MKETTSEDFMITLLVNDNWLSLEIFCLILGCVYNAFYLLCTLLILLLYVSILFNYFFYGFQQKTSNAKMKSLSKIYFLDKLFIIYAICFLKKHLVSFIAYLEGS